jgi:hypothetical protein
LVEFALAPYFRRAQEAVPKDKFGPLQGGEDVVVRTLGLRPTPGFEMTIVRESKALSHTLNFKRRGVVRKKMSSPRKMKIWPRSFQNPVHTTALE